ncbi:DEAD/DEAH box helicase [Pararhodobacter oceanensis]|uniref:DEAD/DEAH box helicase n=1 Tax=Pararhodobacter oceanensis TaxID=2172121 RepID=UPI003A953367
MTKFSDLSLDPKVLKAVEEAGYETPTPIQQQAIPEALTGRDVLGIAQTGTGKTASFTLPLITRLARGRARARMPRSLVLAPTRELAAQVAENFDTYAKYTKLTKALLIGGVSFGEQDKLIDRGVDVLIATPGRLLDHFERGKLLLTGVEVMIVDEADRMLDMGFIPDIERIFQLTPFTRQTLFFSATMAPEIERITNMFLSNPVRVEVARQATTAETITQALYEVKPSRKDRVFSEKRAVLRKLIEDEGEACTNAIIFCNRKIDVDTVAKSLKKHKFDASPIHGDLDQSVRTRTLDGFRDGSVRLLVASDVAARGLDIPAVSHVFNFDVPSHAEDYVHRIGRTGRAGRLGKAFTISTPSDEKYIAAIEHLLQRELPRGDLAAIGMASAAVGGAAADGADSAAAADAGAGETTGKRVRVRKPRSDDSKPRRSRKKDAEVDAAAPAAEVEAEAVAEAPKGEGRANDGRQNDSRKADGRRSERREKRDDKPEQARPDQSRDDKQRGRGRGRGRDEPVVGMGDHVPEFLRREFRAKAG